MAGRTKRPTIANLDMPITLKSGDASPALGTAHADPIRRKNIHYWPLQNRQHITQPVRWLQATSQEPHVNRSA